MVWKIFLMRKSSFDGFLFFIAIFQRALAGMFLEDTAEISLVMVTAHLSDLTDRKRRLIEKQLLCMMHPQIGQIFGRGTVICLAEDLCQITGTVIHIVCDQVQIDIVTVVFYNKIPQNRSNLRGSQRFLH